MHASFLQRPAIAAAARTGSVAVIQLALAAQRTHQAAAGRCSAGNENCRRAPRPGDSAADANDQRSGLSSISGFRIRIDCEPWDPRWIHFCPRSAWGISMCHWARAGGRNES
jgi:hypothetical protein